MSGSFVNKLEEGFISLLLVSMTLFVAWEVVLRFVFNTGNAWGDELVLHMGAWMTLFGASYGVKVGSHIGVDAFVKTLSPAARRFATLLAVAFCLLYCALFLYGSWVYLSKVYRIGIELEDLPVPKWLAHSILLIGFALLGFRFIQLAWQVATGKRDGFGLVDEAKEALELFEEKKPGGARP